MRNNLTVIDVKHEEAIAISSTQRLFEAQITINLMLHERDENIVDWLSQHCEGLWGVRHGSRFLSNSGVSNFQICLEHHEDLALFLLRFK